MFLPFCENCGSYGSFSPEVLVRHVSDDGPPLKPLTAREARNYREIRVEVWGLGWIPTESTFCVLVWGEPGGGKSSFALMVGQAWVRARSEVVLFVSAEEGLGETVSSRLRWLEIIEDRLLIVPACSPGDALSTAVAREVSLVILDSWSVAGWSLTDLAQLKERVSVLFVCHVTKGNELAGPQYLAHYVDQSIHVEGGRFKHVKNRFGPLLEGVVLGVAE
jgi:DNA repair protein RadA/Sms